MDKRSTVPVPAAIAAPNGAGETNGQIELLVRNPSPVPGEVATAFEDRALPRPTSAPVWRNAVTVAMLSGIIFCSSAGNGLTIVSLPAMSAELHLPAELAFWPTSVTSLATASTILISGSVADVIGATVVDQVGCFLLGAFVIAAGASRTGNDMVILRALQGVGLAMHSAASVGIIARILPRGRRRNVAYSMIGLSAPLGFSFGLVLGGILTDTLSWRAGWYIFGSIIVALSILGLRVLPRSLGSSESLRERVKRLRRQVDWVGALLASGFMAMLSYLLASVPLRMSLTSSTLSADITRITTPGAIVLLCVTVLSLPAFLLWVRYQTRRGRAALIPNSFWRNVTFSTICGTLVLSFAVLNSLELFASLFFQEVQHLSPLQASLRILPSLVVGALVNLTIGFIVDKVPPPLIVAASAGVCAISPLLMATIEPQRPYWGNAFFAQLFQPVSCDVLFTVGLVVISEIFPDDQQALAGAVFSMIAQFGNALGPSIMQIISTLVEKEGERAGSPVALMSSYRASFWAMFGMMIACAVWGALGLRKSGRIGLRI